MTSALVPTVRRRGWELGAARSRFATVLAVTIFAVGVAGIVIVPRTTRCFFNSPEGRAALLVKKFVYEAFGTWSLDHVDRRCPGQLEELLEYVNREDITDPWGRDYRFRCTSSDLRTFFVVWSAGPDRKHGTDDDIRSDQ